METKEPLAAVAETVIVAHIVEQVVHFGDLILAVGGPEKTALHRIEETATVSFAVEGLTAMRRLTGAFVGTVVGPEGAIHFIDGNFFLDGHGNIFATERALVLRQNVDGIVDLPPLILITIVHLRTVV